LKGFSNAYSGDFHTLTTFQLTTILDKYARNGWMIPDTFNALIDAIGQKFSQFSLRELVSVCESLRSAGIRSDDIFSEVVKAFQSSEDKESE
jgi:hypothetical protein